MRRVATALSALGFLWAFAATVYIVTGGGQEGISVRFALAGGGAVTGDAGLSLRSPNGVWVVGLLAGVTLLAGMPFGMALSYPEGQRVVAWGAGALLLGFSLVTALTVGLFYAPCALALLAAAIVSGSRGGSSEAGGRRGAA